MLEEIKILLDINHTNSDVILKIMIRDASQKILNYCHINKLPKALEHIVRKLVINNFTTQNEGNIASIKRGDTQVSYNNTITSGDYNETERAELNAYRKWKAR